MDEILGTCDLVKRPHRQSHCGKAWRPLAPPALIFFHFKEYSDCEHHSDNYICGPCAKRHLGELLASQRLSHHDTPPTHDVVEEFYKFAKKIAKRDGWFIGGFLGEVMEEWKSKNE